MSHGEQPLILQEIHSIASLQELQVLHMLLEVGIALTVLDHNNQGFRHLALQQ